VGWSAKFLIEKHKFSAILWAVQKGGQAICTTGWAGGLHIRASWPAAHQRRPALFCSPL